MSQKKMSLKCILKITTLYILLPEAMHILKNLKRTCRRSFTSEKLFKLHVVIEHITSTFKVRVDKVS